MPGVGAGAALICFRRFCRPSIEPSPLPHVPLRGLRLSLFGWLTESSARWLTLSSAPTLRTLNLASYPWLSLQGSRNTESLCDNQHDFADGVPSCELPRADVQRQDVIEVTTCPRLPDLIKVDGAASRR